MDAGVQLDQGAVVTPDLQVVEVDVGEDSSGGVVVAHAGYVAWPASRAVAVGQPRLVDRELAGGESAEPGVFAASDAVFDTGVGAVAGVEEGVLAGAGVGGEADVAPAVTVLDEVQLRTGMGAVRAG